MFDVDVHDAMYTFWACFFYILRENKMELPHPNHVLQTYLCMIVSLMGGCTAATSLFEKGEWKKNTPRKPFS